MSFIKIYVGLVNKKQNSSFVRCYWINKNKLTREKFEWQDEYMTVGVGDDKIKIVRDYIANQEEHHKKYTFQQEYNKFIERYGFDIVKH